MLSLNREYLSSWCAPGDANKDLANEAAIEKGIECPIENI